MSARHIILAAGGTGGHMFPAEALARNLLDRGHQVTLVTDRRGKGFGAGLGAVRVEYIDAAGLVGRGLFGKIKGVVQLGLGYLQARGLVKRLKADCVVGFGGYASVPTALAGAHQGLVLVLHEQNAVLGRANRLLAGKARAIGTAFDRVERLPTHVKVQKVGNPVRAEIAALADHPFPAGPELCLLVIGGSQGATAFNRIVPDAIARLSDEQRLHLAIVQQVRGPGLEMIAERYKAMGLPATLAPFFTDMAKHLGQAHLVLARAGASTAAELALAGRPAILVPYPYAADDHQRANADRLAETGGAWVLTQEKLTPESLAALLTEFLAAPEKLAYAGEAIRKAGVPEAARHLADLVEGACAANGNDTPREEAA